ncbi:hypothetical protein [Microbacterium schleiferi]|uniref:hypothetical protein n=1 Tax=Microbacterium schleiferi TaxID=69362 RepID=UPI001D176C75|nr:hypothetical protein [Microbacterium schleiferi]MCC4269046.1 hypothetical protein [Microbacterium schleiferi]
MTDLSKFTSVLPYASEMFGVYTPLIGWKSGRQLRRFAPRLGVIGTYAQRFRGLVDDPFNADGYPENGPIRSGVPALFRRKPQKDSLLLSSAADMIAERLRPDTKPTSVDEWRALLDEGTLDDLLQNTVRPAWVAQTRQRISDVRDAFPHHNTAVAVFTNA